MTGESSSQPPPQSPPADSTPKRLGKYIVDRKIGQGGMGAVYLGRDPELKRQVALKVLPRDKAANPTLVKRFKAEAQAAAQLRHENIVAVYDSGEADGYLYIAMEYVDGKDLHELIRKRGRIPVNRSIQMIKEVASALQHAHEQNIVHRDIKPSNLLIRMDGKVKLTDLGLARSVDDTLETNITRAGTTVGTVDYMAPEQARNSKLADIRSDLYSLGCTWFHMLTGQPPYPEGSVTNKLQAHAIRPIPNARDLNPKVPEGIVAVLNRMMAKKPEERYQSPAELLADLEQSRLSQGAVGDEIMGAIEQEERDEAVRRGEEPPEPGGRKFGRVKEADARKGSAAPFDEDNDEEEYEEERGPAAADVTPEMRASRKRAREKRRAEREAPEVAGGGSEESGKRRKGQRDEPAAEGKSRGLPPKRKPLEPTEEPEGLNVERLKSVAVVLGVVGLVLGLGWVVSNYASNFFGGPGQIVTDPFAAQRDKAAILSQEPGGVAGGAPMSNPADLPGATPNAPSANSPAATAAANAPGGTTPGDGGPAGARPGAPFDPAAIPAWAGQTAPAGGLKTVTVSTDEQQRSSQPSLAAAVKSLGDKGGRVQILGSGVVTLSGKLGTAADRLVIEAADPKQRPVIVCEVNSAAPGLGLEMSRGVLELQGLHFAANAADLPGTAAVSLVTVVDGQLRVRDCSFTVSGSGTAPVAAISLTTQTDPKAIQPMTPPQVLIERTIVRGGAVTAVDVQRQFADVVVKQSVLLSAKTPVVSLASAQRFVPPEPEKQEPEAAAAPPSPPAGPQRTVRFVESTLVSGATAISLTLNGAGQPPLTNLVFQDSVCCTAGQAEAVLLSAAQWPARRSGQDAGQLQDVTWSSTNSLYLGHAKLVDQGTSSAFKVTDAATWKRFWNSDYKSDLFDPGKTFPAAAPDDWAQFDVAELNRDRIPSRDVVATSGQPPGCETAALSLPGHVSQLRIRALAERGQPPAKLALAPADPPHVLRVDLLKEDLGLVLGRNQWPSGTLIEATGSGNRTMTPARIEGKAVRIVFRQTEGSPPLVIQPKVIDGRAGPAALIAVDKGGLELVGAPLAQVGSVREGAPEHLIVARDSQLIVRQSQLLGPAVEGAQHRGLIRWTSGAGTAERNNPPYLLVADSLLYSPGHLVRAEGGPGQIFLQNSILVARGLGLDLVPSRVGEAIPLTVDMRRCTVASTAAALRIQPILPEGDVRRPLRLYVDETAFAAPFVMKSGEADRAAVLLCEASALERRQVEWWGRANGVAPEFRRFLGRESGDQASAGSLAEWQSLWGADHDVRLLTGDQGVYYANPLSNSFKSIKPQAFALHRSAKASTWGDGGRPIGADVVSVGAEVVPRKAGGTPKPATGGVTKPGATKKPSF